MLPRRTLHDLIQFSRRILPEGLGARQGRAVPGIRFDLLLHIRNRPVRSCRRTVSGVGLIVSRHLVPGCRYPLRLPDGSLPIPGSLNIHSVFHFTDILDPIHDNRPDHEYRNHKKRACKPQKTAAPL